MDKFKGFIEKAEENSKQNFLRFVKGIYNVDESIFDHLWEVPVMAPYEDDSLISATLSTKSEDDILEILDEFIDYELGDSEACFIYLDKMESEFSEEEIEEWQSKLNNEEVQQDYNAIIVYNELKLKKMYKELLQENAKKENPKTIEEIDKIFTNYLIDVITHERCHLNANYLVNEVRNSEFVSEIINGAEITSWEEDDLVTGKKKSRVDAADYADRNEVVVDILAQMINNYQEGDSIEECLYRIIESRNGKSQYNEIDDKEMLAMYTLFPDELTEWAIFGAYDFTRVNKIQEKIIEVCGDEATLPDTKLSKKISDYCSTMENGALTEKQIKMLELLGVKKGRRIDKEEMKEVAKSEKAMEALKASLLDIKSFKGSTKKEDIDQGKDIA